jgi:hypothetical protein
MHVVIMLNVNVDLSAFIPVLIWIHPRPHDQQKPTAPEFLMLIFRHS